MAYDEELANRIRRRLSRQPNIVEKAMFGGVGFLVDGNLCVGVWKSALIARVGPDQYQEALSAPHASEFDITGRAMKGWVLVAADGIANAESLNAWIDRALRFVRTLPRK